ncbi:hypothetical protein F4808DRAFT_299542 [Astrocystis sublimbata]|nr:hypothetical protein F4808DRAFT_299542 [Astrocystis sublimbata]
MNKLPKLTSEPTRHPACCLSLSETLLATIKTLLDTSFPPHLQTQCRNIYAPRPGSDPALLLSIGSGTGLLEELLHNYLNSAIHNDSHGLSSARNESTRNAWRIEGVEVDLSVNIYLPEDRINHVPGTWAVLSSRTQNDAAALMFVYPRERGLVRRYVDAFFNTLTTTKDGRFVLWLGPKCDWEDTGFGDLTQTHTYSHSHAENRDEYEFEVLDMRDGDVGLAEYEMLAVLRLKRK